jgi:hypothetical protein
MHLSPLTFWTEKATENKNSVNLALEQASVQISAKGMQRGTIYYGVCLVTWMWSFLNLMYRFSKQGKHFMKSMTISKLRSMCVKAKTFTLVTTIVELTTHDPCVRCEILTAEQIGSQQERDSAKDMQGYLKSCGTKFHPEPRNRQLTQNLQFWR